MIDDDDTEMHPGYGPLIAVLAGILLLVGATILVPRMLPALPYTTLLGAGAAAGLLLWVIGFAAAIRHAAIAWKLGSLVLLIGAGLLAGHLAGNQYNARGRMDPSSFAEMSFGPTGAPVLPSDAAARGPVSKRFVENAAADATERRAFGAALGKFGAGNLNSPYNLAQNPQTTANCGALDAIKTMAGEQAVKRGQRLAAIRSAIDAAELDAPMKAALHEIAGTAITKDEVLDNQLAGLTATADLCALLAKKSWFNNNYVFGFNSGADMSRYQDLQAARAAAASGAEKLDQARMQRMKAGQEKLQALLS